MPRRGTRAYLTQTLQAYVRRVFENLRPHNNFQKQLDMLWELMPADATLKVVANDIDAEAPWTVDLKVEGVSTEELADAVARIALAPPGRPKGQRRPLSNVALMEKIEAEVEAGKGSVRTASERLAKRAGVPAETLRKQYRRYRKSGVPIYRPMMRTKVPI
jgi:hypothetical protein